MNENDSLAGFIGERLSFLPFYDEKNGQYFQREAVFINSFSNYSQDAYVKWCYERSDPCRR